MITIDSSPAFSAEAAVVAEATEEVIRRFRRAALFGLDASMSELEQVRLACREVGWDGPGSAPVAEATVRYAAAFVRSLPLGIAPPTVGAEPDGQISLDWYRSKRRVLSISVSSDGYLHYAGLFGASRVWGTEAFFGDAPEKILELIEQVTG